ncbi:MAG: hypothetical protein JWL83_1150 [Actinomycetia bacterium]|nr:hypothetical protein [Actinomycetes bacterium]
MAFTRDCFVQVRPIVGHTTGGCGVHLTQQSRESGSLESIETVVRTGKFGIALDGNPIPARTKHHGDARARAQVGELLYAASRDEADDAITGHRVIEDARVDYRHVRRAVGPCGDNDRETVFSGPEFLRPLESRHVASFRVQHQPYPMRDDGMAAVPALASHGYDEVAGAESPVAGAMGRCRRFNITALTATMMLDPDIESAAISGRNVKPSGSNTPAAMGSAMAL